MNKTVTIIGAGIAGLSAGCYLQMNGYETEIYELHNIPGGLCTSWKRKGYTFDGCIHWLCGSSPANELYTIWEELGAIQDKKIVNHEIFMYTDLGNNKSFSVYCDTAKLKQEMLRFAPEDEKLINEFIKAIETTKKSNLPVLKPQELFNAIDGIKLAVTELPLLRLVNKWGKISLLEFQNKFTNPFLHENFVKLFGMSDDIYAFALIYTLALLDLKTAGYPIGGSIEFAKSIEKKYKSLGGKVNYNSKVTKILVEDNKAVGIQLDDGTKHLSDLVISAADGHYTLFNMLEGKYIDDKTDNFYKTAKIFPALIQVSLGVAREFKDTPDAVTINIPLKKEIIIDPKNTLKDMPLKIYNFDPTLAPEGKTSLVTIAYADYDYWINLKKSNIEKYTAEKRRIANEIIDAIDDKYGNVKNNIDVYDVATPDTFVRYTNNWQGSFEGFLPTKETFGKNLKMELPGLENFYMIGQWVAPGGGLPTGGMHGRHLAQILCKKHGKKFKVVK